MSILKQESKLTREIWEAIDNSMKNAFEELSRELKLNLIKRQFLKIYWWYISRKMQKQASDGKSLEEIERMVADVSSRISTKDVKLPYLRNRAKRAKKLIAPYLVNETVFDIGCGDGLLVNELGNDFSVIGGDILDYREKEARNFSFIQINEGHPIDLTDNSIDNTILWTVLHHSDDPEFLLEEAVRITRNRIIIVEGYVNDTKNRLMNSFLDWYLNRPAKNQDVNVPLNYRTTTEWKQLFDFLGCEIIHEEYLGIDEPVVPESHMLYILDVSK